ncbi:hypothetical protein AGMMS50230_15080 [Spirochaetia bacterium]|nr:hypothetical protein AGMMS50230_15080 [Spirochaetia bacterium]
MSITEKKQIIELPLKFVFTEEGASDLMRQKVRFNRLTMGDKSEDYGVLLDKVTPAFLQRMVMADYISKIEVSGVEPVESRSDIIELSKLIVSGILYRNYAEVSLEQVLKADPVKQWNHANPSLVIDEKTQFKEGLLQSFVDRHEDELRKMQDELVEPIYARINNDETLLPDEIETHKELLQNFVGAVYPLTWFVLLKFRKTREFYLVIRDVRSSLSEFLKKSNIAEYASLLLMELASNIENLNILREAKLLYGTSQVDMQTVLQDPKLRLPVIESLRKKNNLLTFSWKLGGTSLAIGKRGRFQILLYDRDINYKETRESFEVTKAADVKRFNLSEFYQKLHGGGNDLELGMFYLSFVSEACENMGIRFESMVTQFTAQTITTLTFGI